MNGQIPYAHGRLVRELWSLQVWFTLILTDACQNSNNMLLLRPDSNGGKHDSGAGRISALKIARVLLFSSRRAIRTHAALVSLVNQHEEHVECRARPFLRTAEPMLVVELNAINFLPGLATPRTSSIPSHARTAEVATARAVPFEGSVFRKTMRGFD